MLALAALGAALALAAQPPRQPPPQPHWEWSWRTVSTWAMPGFTTATEQAVAPAPAPPPRPRPAPPPSPASGKCGWYGFWSDAGCRTWAAGPCRQQRWTAPPGHPSHSVLHQRLPDGTYRTVGRDLFCADPTLSICGPNCTQTDADCRATCEREQHGPALAATPAPALAPAHAAAAAAEGASPPPGSAGQMTDAEARYYSNFTIFSTQTWDVACDGGTAVCANFNDCECVNASTGLQQGTWRPDEERRMMVAARATRRYSPRQPYVPYAYFSVSQSHYAGQAPFNLPEHAGLWLRDATGRPLNGTPALGGEHDRLQTFCAGLRCPRWLCCSRWPTHAGSRAGDGEPAV